MTGGHVELKEWLLTAGKYKKAKSKNTRDRSAGKLVSISMAIN